MTKSIQDMVDNIKRILTKNGFPTNAVTLPLERLYESAHRAGLNFNKVLDQLTSDGISHEKTAEKIIFSAAVSNQENKDSSNPFAGIDFEAVRKMYESMSPEERANIMEMAQKMGAGAGAPTPK